MTLNFSKILIKIKLLPFDISFNENLFISSYLLNLFVFSTYPLQLNKLSLRFNPLNLYQIK